MEAALKDYFDDWSQHSRRHLCEASLRLLATLGSEPRFPGDPAGIEALIGRVAKGRPGEAMDFAVEPAGKLPRYTGEYLTWVSPAADGCLRLRHEFGELRSEAVVLRPDGRLDEFEAIDGFGVPASALTEQARADSEAVERLAREREAEEVNHSKQIDDEQRRFRTEHLIGTRAAPPQDDTGPVVTFLVLYETGVIVNYLVPRPPDEDLETDDPFAEPLSEAMLPRIELSDGLGTAYEVVDLDKRDANAPLLRVSQSFVPAVPGGVARLSVGFETGSVEIELGER
jgi:hypothetical protein